MNSLILVCEGLRNRAGIERMTVELANLLANEFNVKIVVINEFSEEDSPFEIDKRVEIITLNLPFKKAIYNLNIPVIKALRKIFKTDRPDAVITVATPLARLTVPACAGLKIRNIAWEHFNIYAGSKLGTFFKVMAPWFVDTTVVLTEKDRKDYQKNHAPRVVAIPNFTTIGKNVPSACKNKILLAVGRHAPQKGFDMLIRAWSLIDVPDWKLRIVGSGADREKNESLARELGLSDRIEFKDAHQDIVKDFQEASCFVLSSRYEGLVLVLIEAKMMGLPCISFDCPNSPREILRDGVDGWLVPAEEVVALAEEISLRLENMDSLKEAGKQARKDALLRYSPESVKEMWTNIIES